MRPLYTPPCGYYDQPFTWVFEAGGLTDGQSYPNQFVYLKGGYGDFVLRRFLGMSRTLNPATGQFQIKDKDGGYLESGPVFSANNKDNLVTPESWYPETGSLGFDLYNVLRNGAQPLTAQLAFQGVRRIKGTPAHQVNYKYIPRTFVYRLFASFNFLVNAGPVVTVYKQITDYDFELHQIVIVPDTNTAGPGLDPADVVDSFAKLWVYDAWRQQISSAPVLDLYINGAPGSPFKNGAIVPPLLYPGRGVQSQIQVDVYSAVTNAALLPITLQIYLVGRQLIPC